MDQQVLYVKQRLQNYLARITALSQATTPPGRNAANGWFREYMVGDAEIVRAGEPPTLALTGDAQELFRAYTFFYSVVQRAFRDNANHSANWTQGSVLWPNLGQIIGEIAAVGSAVIQLFSGDSQAKEAAKKNLALAIDALMRKIDQAGDVWGGAHANGWISVYARDAGGWTLGELNKSFPQGTASDAGRVADVLRVVCEQMAALPTQGHDPWLKADWQVRFQAISEAGAATLASYN